jgi:diacylglycerol O-acyltransferase / wax synthase
MAQRELRFESKMSDAEALMWNVEHDPRMLSNIGTVTICDRPLDFKRLREKMAAATANISRMRERVAPVLGRLAPPVWQPDPDFDLDYHVRRISLPAPGDIRQLHDLCCQLLQEPFDRTRPLWLFVAIDGLAGGKGALFTKLHHTISDGEGAVRLAEHYMDIERDPPPPPEVDLDELISKAKSEAGSNGGEDFAASLLRTAGHTWRRAVGVARRTAGEAALAVADPQRLAEAAANLNKAASAAVAQMTDTQPGSPLWANRSRRRYFDTLELDLDEAKRAGKDLGGSLNDVFVCGAAMAAAKYHAACGVEAPYFNAAFMVSTREGGSAGGNAFTMSKVRVDAGEMTPAERFSKVREALGVRRRDVTGGVDLLGAVSGVANMLPTSVLCTVAFQQAASVDFATSNVRAADFELYIAGAKVESPYPMGPVAGTAWNITMLSYCGRLFMGVHLDPAAVEDPGLLMRSLRESYAELLSPPKGRKPPGKATKAADEAAKPTKRRAEGTKPTKSRAEATNPGPTKATAKRRTTPRAKAKPRANKPKTGTSKPRKKRSE